MHLADAGVGAWLTRVQAFGYGGQTTSIRSSGNSSSTISGNSSCISSIGSFADWIDLLIHHLNTALTCFSLGFFILIRHLFSVFCIGLA